MTSGKSQKSNSCTGVEMQHWMSSRVPEHSLVFMGKQTKAISEGDTTSLPLLFSSDTIHDISPFSNNLEQHLGGLQKAFSKHCCRQAFTIHSRIKLLILSASMRFLKVHIV